MFRVPHHYPDKGFWRRSKQFIDGAMYKGWLGSPWCWSDISSKEAIFSISSHLSQGTKNNLVQFLFHSELQVRQSVTEILKV